MVIIPRSNLDDVLIEDRYRGMIEVIPVDHIEEVLQNALVPENREGFLSKLKKMAVNPTGIFDPNLGRSLV